MNISLYDRYGAMNSAPVFASLAQGFDRLGHRVSYHDDSADVAVIWSQLWAGRMLPNKEIFDQFTASGRPVFVIEVGTLFREHTWRVLLNGAHKFLVTGQDHTRARRRGLPCEPWRNRGDHLVIALQRPESQQWSGMPDTITWLKQVIDSIRCYSDRKILIRPHPRLRDRIDVRHLPTGCQIQSPMKLSSTYDSFDFETALDQAWAVINWNSNPGVVAVVHGVPAFVGADSLAAPVANLDLSLIESPTRPDRTQWINDLAWHEWTLEEFQSGEALIPVLAAINADRNS